MEPKRSKASWVLRRALKFRSQRWRRGRVILSYLWLVAWMVYVLGEENHRHRVIFQMMIWTMILLSSGVPWFRRWRSERLQTTENPDEMAQALYGVNFAELGKLQQGEVQTTLMEGNFSAERAADERENDQKLRANSTAFRIVQWGLSGFASVYWGAWVFLPDWLGGRIDLQRVLNPGWWILWVTALVITLPQMVRLWTEPDVAGEPMVVGMEREA
jgi:hypothetical protein